MTVPPIWSARTSDDRFYRPELVPQASETHRDFYGSGGQREPDACGPDADQPSCDAATSPGNAHVGLLPPEP
jgi:hypothetical protein